jgi:putative SOS response-associated peptidase YedK
MRAQWGLVPFWAKNRNIGSRMINARSETAYSSGAFRAAMRKRRCIVPADGWYEWKKVERDKQPYRFHRADEAPLAMAGLYEHWMSPETGEVLDSFTVLTTTPNKLAATVHDRMPVLLHPKDWEQWLDPSQHDSESLTQLLLPWGDQDLVATPVSKRVGNVRNNSKELIEAVELAPIQGTLF